MSQEHERRKRGMYDKEFYDKMMEVHNDLRHLVSWTKEHDEKDNKRFEETNRKVDLVTKVAYMGLGGLAVINVLIGFLN